MMLCKMGVYKGQNPAFPAIEAYAEQFRGAFRRRDQFRWMIIYLQGLFTCPGRKNVERIAQHVSLPPGMRSEDAAQALQNFVNQSAWDERPLWRIHRSLLAKRFAADPGVLVVDDLAFPKQGLASVGVQRQYASQQGRKLNCQLAVTVHTVGATQVHPVAMRLYLPRSWSSSPERLARGGVPQELQAPRSRIEIALDLLDELLEPAWPARTVVAPVAYGNAHQFREGLRQRGLHYCVEVATDPAPASSIKTETSLERLERVWPLQVDAGSVSHFITDGNSVGDESAVAALWSARRRAVDACNQLRAELGLDHFEGRSWRGFHHHACLVTLADGLRRMEAAKR